MFTYQGSCGAVAFGQNVTAKKKHHQVKIINKQSDIAKCEVTSIF